IEAGQLELFGGQANLTGEARWNPAQSWRVEGRMNDLDAAQLRADLPGRLDFAFRAGGAPFGEEGSLQLAIAQLRGTVREQRVDGSGVISRAGGSTDWRFDDVDVTVGSAHIQLDGG